MSPAPAPDPGLALPSSFYEQRVDEVARDLLGCLLVSAHEPGVTAGIIVETEAYGGVDDPASHASFRRNGAVRAMWGPAGTAYVYRAYGVYPCFNVVTGRAGEPSAILVRALQPVVGVETMRTRLGTASRSRLTSGPGKLSLALGITLGDNQRPLDAPPLWIQPGVSALAVVAGPRIGVRRALDRHWRFGIAGHPDLSRRFPSTG